MRNIIESNRVLLLAVALVLLVVAAIYLPSVYTPRAQGSVAEGQEYTATTTGNGQAGLHLLAKTTFNGSSCGMGSVIVASSSATTFTVWNATSTTDVASTTITKLKAGIVEGTYTFDVSCRGVVIEAPAGFNGFYTTTYR